MMNDFPSREVVARLRARFPQGCRVKLVRMTDPYTTLKPGDRGTVDFVDGIGTIFCTWDCGSTLGVAFGEDEIVRIDKEDAL